MLTEPCDLETAFELASHLAPADPGSDGVIALYAETPLVFAIDPAPTDDTTDDGDLVAPENLILVDRLARHAELLDFETAARMLESMPAVDNHEEDEAW